MLNIIQIFIKQLDPKTILRWYIKTSHKYKFLLDEAKIRLKKNDLYSLKDEDNLLNKLFMLQVNKSNTDDVYDIAIHTSMTYVLVKVCKHKTPKKSKTSKSSKTSNTVNGKIKYEAVITKVITSDESDYTTLKDVMLPSMFLEFIAYGVNVYESNDCTKTFPIRKHGVLS